MPFNPSGIYQRLYSWVTDRDNGLKILAQRMDDEMNGIVAAINQITSGAVGFRGPVRTTTGTAAVPAFSFKDDTNTGMYRAGEDMLGLTAGAGDFRIGPTTLTYNTNPVYHAGNKPTPADLGLGPLATIDIVGPARGGTGANNVAQARVNLGLGAVATDNVVPVSRGGTGATTAGAARTALGLANVVTTDTAQPIVAEKTFSATMRMNVPGAGSAGDLLVAMQNGANVLTHRITAGGNYEMITAVGAALRLTSGGPGIIANVGRGDVAIESNSQDGSDGAGVCFRTLSNPTGTAMFFSTRLAGGALGVGVSTDRVSVGRPDIYVGTATNGTGGSLVSHAGQSTGDVGTYAMLRDNAVVGSRSPGAIVAGSNLQYATSDGDAAGASPSGAWQLMGRTQDSGTTSRTSLWMRVS